MANSTLLQSINATLNPGWVSNCIARLNTSDYDWTRGIVDGNGDALPGLTEDAWGITIGTCYKYCNQGFIPYSSDFNFQTFAGAMTNYYLPWLALTAQLPFENGDPKANFMSFCLAVGSPAMITYSLTITILNRFWVREKFAELQQKAAGPNVQDRYGGYAERIRAAQYLLQEAQQVPLRASQERGWLSSLVVVPENKDWWTRAEERIKSTRRGFTASLVAQMALAAIAYLFTVIASFMASLGDPTTALQIASGSLWIWLIPVILGWITVGTQYSHHSIQDALKAERAYRALEPPIQGVDYTLLEEQRGLLVRSGLSPQPHRAQTQGFLDAPDIARLQIPNWCGAGVESEEQQKGPTFNYARLFTWWQLAHTIEETLFHTLDNISQGRVCQDIRQYPGVKWDNAAGAENLTGPCAETAIYCGLGTGSIKAYPTWGDMPSEVYRRMFAAAVAGVFVQWGTTGASILIAYKTPTVGLGCRSTSYIVYGAAGTTAWILLVVSTWFSHSAMLRYQQQHIDNPSMDFRIKGDPQNPNQYSRSFMHSSICGAAVITRYCGKMLAIANTLVLLLTSLFEFIGLFDNCWCQGNAIGLHHKGWVLLFKGAPDLKAAAASSWFGGLAMTIVVCTISYVFFALGSQKTDDD
ncbi:hypothetical protein LTR62_004778 [Meristemomyces frigidus]|uniref:Uncharacterized protein n=1 Tax=Meristemomyces frigidus TaxID=1508187 RepID=A0AAN7YNX2_9PEZI|nr:hypothetical protein LTR62_004778 [Meristemomyces frigidus]